MGRPEALSLTARAVNSAGVTCRSPAVYGPRDDHAGRVDDEENVVQVHRRVAMAGNQREPIADRQIDVGFHADLRVLVRQIQAVDAVVRAERKAVLGADRLEPSVEHGGRFASADRRGQAEERRLER
jgi:hypothetical protein